MTTSSSIQHLIGRILGFVERLRRLLARLSNRLALRLIGAHLRRWYVARRVRHVFGPRRLASGRHDLVVVCLVRDGGYYVRSFVEHYQRLGAAHLVFLDNGSTDDTLDRLRSYAGVTMLRSSLPFKQYQNDLRRYLIQRFGAGRWCLYVDIDELFDYPASNRLALRDLLRYLDAGGYTAVVGQMVDMFSDTPIGEQPAAQGELLADRYRYYDLTNIERLSYARYYGQSNQVSNPALDILVGGIRKTVFDVDTWLTKHPLIFGDGRIRPMLSTSHTVSNARIADISCALLHYKLISNFAVFVDRGVREEGYYRNSEQYKQYQEALHRQRSITLMRATARKLASVDDLVGLDVLVISPSYERWVRCYGRRWLTYDTKPAPADSHRS